MGVIPMAAVVIARFTFAMLFLLSHVLFVDQFAGPIGKTC